jgi:hypothetical protein
MTRLALALGQHSRISGNSGATFSPLLVYLQ